MLRVYESDHFDKAHLWNKDVRKITARQVHELSDKNLVKAEKFFSLNKKTLLFDAKIDLDAYLQYVEFNRDLSSQKKDYPTDCTVFAGSRR